jgi:hypothetical protein
MAAILYNFSITNKPKIIPDHFIKDLNYSLLYKDLSKRGLMILAEAFTDKHK